MQGVPTHIFRLPLTGKIESIARRLPSRRFQIAAGAVVLAGIALALLLSGGGSDTGSQHAPPTRHPAAVEHVPGFIAAPGSPDVLLGVVAVVLIGAVLATGVLFFWLHSLPERLVHKSTKVHLDIVAVLALLSLFTHVHLFWVAALLIALVKIPDFSFFTRQLQRMTVSLERIADAQPREGPENTVSTTTASQDERKPC